MQTKVASSHDRISPTGSKYEESRNDWIIWMSKEKLINSIDFMEFVNIKQVAFGGSGVIQKALWKTKTEQKYVILKQVLHDSSKMEKLEQDELVKEVKALHHISKMKTNAETGDTDHKYIVEFFGISNPISENSFPEFYLVLEYADRGDLRNYLCRNNLEWKCKVDISRHIAHGLRFLHKNEILHRDLHTGNVVIKSDNNTQFGIRAIITDFGLSRVVCRHSISNQRVKGCIEFMDPIILNKLDKIYGEIYKYSSDIYSLGIIFWEITSNYNSRTLIGIWGMTSIIKGVREQPVAGSTISYVKLYKKCWDENPDNRPDINCVCELINEEDIVSGEVWKEMNEPKTELNEHGRYKNLLDNASTEYEFKNVKDAFDRFSTEHPDQLINLVIHFIIQILYVIFFIWIDRFLKRYLAPIYHSIQILLSIGNWIFYLRIFENRNSNKPE